MVNGEITAPIESRRIYAIGGASALVAGTVIALASLGGGGEAAGTPPEDGVCQTILIDTDGDGQLNIPGIQIGNDENGDPILSGDTFIDDPSDPDCVADTVPNTEYPTTTVADSVPNTEHPTTTAPETTVPAPTTTVEAPTTTVRATTTTVAPATTVKPPFGNGN